jgi:hypothetical protein
MGVYVHPSPAPSLRVDSPDLRSVDVAEDQPGPELASRDRGNTSREKAGVDEHSDLILDRELHPARGRTPERLPLCQSRRL